MALESCYSWKTQKSINLHLVNEPYPSISNAVIFADLWDTKSRWSYLVDFTDEINDTFERFSLAYRESDLTIAVGKQVNINEIPILKCIFEKKDSASWVMQMEKCILVCI